MNNLITIEKKAFAKVNLFLKILGKRADNYHEIFTVMHMIDIFDTVRVNIAKGEYTTPLQINISCGDKSVPSDERNTAYKSVRLYFEYLSKNTDAAKYNISAVNIEIVKRIPLKAGLGGGSSDAASVLLALNEYFYYALAEDMLLEIAGKIGADVSFFIKMKDGGTALCEGIGEIVTPIRGKTNFDDFIIDILKPDCGISTKEAFAIFDSAKSNNSPCFDRNYIISVFENGGIKDIADIMHNDFEEIIIPSNEDIKKAKAKFIERGAVAAQLSGSGSAVFGIFLK